MKAIWYMVFSRILRTLEDLFVWLADIYYNRKKVAV